jgi:Asp-tRNA(Asn)/Glu-tRNA(Gln) amidotransferase A subunit family amidase
MSERKSRREFVGGAALGVVVVALGGKVAEGQAGTQTSPSTGATPGAPPAFGTSPAVGPEVTLTTFAEAEKMVQAPLTTKDRAEAQGNWRQSMAALVERRVGPRKVRIPDSVAPYSNWNPVLDRTEYNHGDVTIFRMVRRDAGVLPAADAEIAFAPVWKLSQWVQGRKITSVRLTEVYLERIKRYNGELRCVITATPEIAMAQARAADQEIAAGKYRGPLHGIPWGGKDLLDTAGIRTTYGAECFETRVPAKDAVVVQRLHAAGAVMVAKLSMGALALNDVWFGGQTMNPWLLEEGASGSSAGPGSATAAGLVGFSIGSETGGSIVSPTMRCGVNGLRPTFGRVPRTGAMTLCWSLDKLGPMCRSVEDTMLVLHAISGYDEGDLGSVEAIPPFVGTTRVDGLKVGYFPGWMQEAPATEVDRRALEMVTKLGMTAVPVTLPDWPYESLNTILFAESAAAFEEITLDHRVDELKAQVPDAWPNTFRQSRFLSAVDYVQADRLRRMVAMEMARVMSEVDLLLVPSLRDEMLTISNNTGHPSLTLRAGFVEVTETRSDWAPGGPWSARKLEKARRVPHGVTLIGRLFDEGTIARAGLAMEAAFGVSGENPPGFA